MPKIDVNKKRGAGTQVDLETFWADNEDLQNTHNTLLPVSWGIDMGHGVSSMPDKQHDLFIPIGKNENGYVTFDLTLGHNILAGGSMLSGAGMFRRVSLASLLKRSSSEIKVVLIDQKGLLSDFENKSPLQFPRTKTPSDDIKALEWCQKETDRRCDLLEKEKVTSISNYNKFNPDTRLPSIAVFITELGDLTEIPNFDTLLYKIAGMSRATNIHLIATTQQPSAAVITPVIQDTFSNRTAFQMPYEAESELFIGRAGAEELLGQGDMLFRDGYSNTILHLQGLHLDQDFQLRQN